MIKVLKYISIALIAALLISISCTALSTAIAMNGRYIGIESTSTNRDPGRVIAALKLIELIRSRIDYIISLANTYGINIPENLSLKIDQALETLSNASSLVSNDPREAISLALKAYSIFKPVTIYVFQNLPEEVKKELFSKKMLRVLEYNLAMVKHITKRIDILVNKGVVIPQYIHNMIQNTEKELENIEKIIESGNYSIKNIAKQISKAGYELGKIYRALYRYTKSLHEKASRALYAIANFVKSFIRMHRTLNMSILLIDRGDIDEAKIVLSILANHTEHVVLYIDRLLNKTNMSTEISSLLTTLRDTLQDVKTYIINAIEYLDEGNITKAKESILKAMEIIRERVSLISPTTKELFKEALFVRIITQKTMNRVRELTIKNIHRTIKILHRAIHKIEHRLHRAYELYIKGNLTAEDFSNILNRSENTLRYILAKLYQLPVTPKKLIEYIEGVIEWIESVKP